MPPEEVESRIPAHSIEAEAAILSLCLVDPEAFKKSSSMLRIEDFYSRAHQEIYSGCIAVHRAGGAIDVVRVAQWLKDAGKIDSAGGMAYLTEVLNAAPNTYNVVYYAKIVRNKARVRDLVVTCQKIVATGYASHGDDSEFLVKSGSKVRDITRVADVSAMRSNVDALRSVFLQLQHNGFAKEAVTGLSTGLTELDKLTTGFHSKQLIIVGARPAAGKSALLLQVADSIASKGLCCLYYSLEMSAEELIKRQISLRSGVDSTMMEIGGITQVEWSKVTESVKDISNLPIMIDDTAEITIQQLRERALGAIDECANKKQPVAAILVDYAQRLVVPPEDRRKNRVDQVADMAIGLKQLARETALPVIAAAQLRRAPEGNKTSRPTIDSLRESGSLESEADVVILLHRPHQYDHKADANYAELLVEKNRSGRTGLIKARWHPELTKFSDWSDT